MGRKSHTEEEKSVRIDKDIYKTKAEDTKEKYEAFILWIVDRLKPSGLLPSFTDESVAKTLINELVSDFDNVNRELKRKEAEWNEEKTVLIRENKELNSRILELEKSLNTLQKELKKLKKDMVIHSEKAEEIVKDKSFLDVLRNIFTRK